MNCRINLAKLLLAKSILKHRINHSVKEELENKEYDENQDFMTVLCFAKVK